MVEEPKNQWTYFLKTEKKMNKTKTRQTKRQQLKLKKNTHTERKPDKTREKMSNNSQSAE